MQAIMAIGRPMMSDETYHKHKILSSDKYRDCLAEHYDRDQVRMLLFIPSSSDLDSSSSWKKILEAPLTLLRV